MRKQIFGDFVNKKKRESIKQLGIVQQMLEKNGLKVESFLETDDGDDPYIFCHSHVKHNSFDGVRIYKIGNSLAFRVQKENKTHPYGAAYQLPVEEMFHDFMSDDGVDEMKAGKKIIESIGKEVRRFFDKSSEADKKNIEDSKGFANGDVAVRQSPMDYGSLINNKS